MTNDKTIFMSSKLFDWKPHSNGKWYVGTFKNVGQAVNKDTTIVIRSEETLDYMDFKHSQISSTHYDVFKSVSASIYIRFQRKPEVKS